MFYLWISLSKKQKVALKHNQVLTPITVLAYSLLPFFESQVLPFSYTVLSVVFWDPYKSLVLYSNSKGTNTFLEVIEWQQQQLPFCFWEALPASSWEASLEFKWKNLPPTPLPFLSARWLFCPWTTHQPVTETSNYHDNSSPGSWKRIPGLSVAAVAENCFSVWFTLWRSTVGGWGEFLLNEAIFLSFLFFLLQKDGFHYLFI